MNYYHRLLAACVITLCVLIPADSQLLAVANCQPLITTRLAQGSRGQEVVNLQNFLINQGFLTQGNASGYFGRMTLAALKTFQSQYNIVSSGTANTTGYGAVGPKTRDVINTMNCGGASQVSSGMTTSSSLSTTNTNNSTSKYARLTVNGSHQPSAVVAGSAVNLTWDVSPSTMSCSAFATPSDSTPWGTGTAGVVPVSGSQVMHPQVKTNYIISCVDSLTSSGVYDTVTVDVTAGNLSAAMMSSSNLSSNTVSNNNVIVELKADGKDGTSLIQYGWASTLTWNVFPAATAVTSCTGSGSGLGTKDVDAVNWNKTQGRYGVLSVWPTAVTTYKITCLLSDGQQVSDTVTVDVATTNGQYSGLNFSNFPPPTVALSAITPGVSQWNLQVSFTGADSCVRNKNGVFYSNYFTGGSNSSQTSQFTANVENVPYTVSITCTGPGGTITSAPVTIAVPPPTVTLTANPTTIASGQTSNLTWSSSNASGCTASGVWSGSKPLSGSQTTGPLLAATNTFNLSCSGAGGTTSSTAVVSVANAPVVTLTASSTTVSTGQSTRLSWSGVNLTSCTASGAWTGAKSIAGSISTGPLTASMNTFTITCVGTGNNGPAATASVTVSVTNGGGSSVDLKVNGGDGPVVLTSGSLATLSWNATISGTNSQTPCVASSNPNNSAWSIARPLTGTYSVYPSVSTTYFITCTDSQGQTASDSVLVSIGNNQLPNGSVALSVAAWKNNGSSFVPLADNASIPIYDPIDNSSVSSLDLSWKSSSAFDMPSTTCTVSANGANNTIPSSKQKPYLASDGLTIPPATNVDSAVTYTVTCVRSSDGAVATDSKTVTVTSQQQLKFSLSTRVVVSGSNANVRSTPSLNGAVLGVQNIGRLGTIIGGPTVASGYTWWNVDYDNAPDGWSVEDYLSQYTNGVEYTTPSQILSLTASPTVITNGGSATISFNAKASHCNLLSGTDVLKSWAPYIGNGPVVVSGTFDVAPISTWTYTLECHKEYGVPGSIASTVVGPTVSQTVTITVNDGVTPTINSFSASPTSNAVPRQSLDLSWSADATSCNIYQYTLQNGSTGGGFPGVSGYIHTGGPNGSIPVSPKTSGSFTLVCTRNNKTVAQSIPVTLEPYVVGTPAVQNIVGWQNRSGNNAVVDVKINNQDNSNGFVTLKNGDPFTVTWDYTPSGVATGDVEICAQIEPYGSGTKSNGSMSFVPGLYGQARTQNNLWYPQMYFANQAPLTVVMTCMKGVADRSTFIQNGANSSGTQYYQWYQSSTDTVTLKLTQ